LDTFSRAQVRNYFRNIHYLTVVAVQAVAKKFENFAPEMPYFDCWESIPLTEEAQSEGETGREVSGCDRYWLGHYRQNKKESFL
jgi:hypothetical protein